MSRSAVKNEDRAAAAEICYHSTSAGCAAVQPAKQSQLQGATLAPHRGYSDLTDFWREIYSARFDSGWLRGTVRSTCRAVQNISFDNGTNNNINSNLEIPNLDFIPTNSFNTEVHH